MHFLDVYLCRTFVITSLLETSNFSQSWNPKKCDAIVLALKTQNVLLNMTIWSDEQNGIQRGKSLFCTVYEKRHSKFQFFTFLSKKYLLNLRLKCLYFLLTQANIKFSDKDWYVVLLNCLFITNSVLFALNKLIFCLPNNYFVDLASIFCIPVHVAWIRNSFSVYQH